MASVSYECNAFYHRVFLPEIKPETHHTPPRFIQIELTINVVLMFIRHDCITGNFTTSSTNPFLLPRNSSFRSQPFKKPTPVSASSCSHVYKTFGINPASSTFYDTIIHEIIELGFEIADWTFNRGYNCKVLPLRSVIRASIVEHENNQEILIRRAMAESALEFERSNYGMVAAKETSVKEMLKRVRVEDGDEDCMICLEELKIGFDASRMPCSHTFHVNCIKKWLKQSHYCPICRFKMPTN